MGPNHQQRVHHPPRRFLWDTVRRPPTSQGASGECTTSRNRASLKARGGPRSCVNTSVMELQAAIQKKSHCEQDVAEAEAKLARVREEVPVPTAPHEDAKAEVERLKATDWHSWSRSMVFVLPKGRRKQRRTSVCRRCVAINGAGSLLLAGRQTRGTPRCSGHGRQGVRRHYCWIDLKRTGQVGKFLSAPICSVEHGFMRRVVARYGFRGVRVGEASHPGPLSRLRPRRSLRSGNLSGETRLSPDQETGVSVAPATTLPTMNILPTWPVIPTSMQAECRRVCSMLFRRI